MSHSSFQPEWVSRFSNDPFAVLGIAVTADDRRVQRRNRQVQKKLHPDRHHQSDNATKQFVEQLLARLVNPAYEKLEQEKDRKETLALLRLQVRRITRQAPLNPQSEAARTLMGHPASGVEVFYEQAVAQLAEAQYEALDPAQFEAATQQLAELNLVYLRLTMGEEFFRERRQELVPAPEKPIPTPPPPEEVVRERYDERHYRRAQVYMKQADWYKAQQELQDAIRIEPKQSRYHSLLGVAYFQQNKAGMARVHLRQALKLDPNDSLGVKYAKKIGVDLSSTEQKQDLNGHTAAPQTTNGQTHPSPSGQGPSKKPRNSKVKQSHRFSSWLRSLINAFRSLFGFLLPKRR